MAIPETALFLKRTFAAPRAKVFEAWTKPEMLLNWFAGTPDHVPCIAEVDLRVGGKYRIGMKHRPTGNEHIATGVYQEIVANERLVFTWRWELGGSTNDETLVTVQLRDNGGSTEMDFKHERFATQELAERHKQGWESCFAQFEKAV